MATRNRGSSLTAEQVEKINQILRSGKRVELIPVRKGVRIMAISRTDESPKTE
jgi:hypothetical protein